MFTQVDIMSIGKNPISDLLRTLLLEKLSSLGFLQFLKIALKRQIQETDINSILSQSKRTRISGLPSQETPFPCGQRNYLKGCSTVPVIHVGVEGRDKPASGPGCKEGERHK